MPRSNKTFLQLTSKTYNTEIGFAGYDAVEKTINGKRVSYDARKAQTLEEFDLRENADHQKRREYRNSVPRQIASFFFGNFLGMRNDTEAKNVGRTLIKNMVWWPEAAAPRAQRVMQWIGMGIGFVTLITPAYALYSLSRNLVMNSAKLVLKFIPQLVVNGLTELQKRINDRVANDHLSPISQFGLEVAHVSLSFIKAPFQAWGFIGGAVLSPIDNFRIAYKNGGLWLAALSVAITAIAYAVLLPIVAAVVAKQVPAFFSEVVSPFFSNTVVPFFAEKTPWLVDAVNAVVSVVSPVASWVGNLVSGLYHAVNDWVSDGLTWVWNSIAGTEPFSTTNLLASYTMTQASALTGLDLSAKLVGLGAMLSAGVTVIGTPFVRLYQFVSNQFVNNTTAPVVPAAAAPQMQPLLIAEPVNVQSRSVPAKQNAEVGSSPLRAPGAHGFMSSPTGTKLSATKPAGVIDDASESSEATASRSRGNSM